MGVSEGLYRPGLRESFPGGSDVQAAGAPNAVSAGSGPGHGAGSAHPGVSFGSSKESWKPAWDGERHHLPGKLEQLARLRGQPQPGGKVLETGGLWQGGVWILIS